MGDTPFAATSGHFLRPPLPRHEAEDERAAVAGNSQPILPALPAQIGRADTSSRILVSRLSY